MNECFIVEDELLSKALIDGRGITPYKDWFGDTYSKNAFL